jgi:hypothetical protein
MQKTTRTQTRLSMPMVSLAMIEGTGQMRIKTGGRTIVVQATRQETYDWANRPGKSWPCSSLASHSLYVMFEDGNLVEFSCDGGKYDRFVDMREFNAFIEDAMATLSD